MKRILYLLFIVNIAQAQPIKLGTTEELRSAILGESRQLNIYLPQSYKPSDTTRYPVVYLLDGGLDEDFIHVAGLIQFNTQPWVNRMPACILVGIANTDRKRDFTSGTEKFTTFLDQELKPYITAHYKTRGPNTIIGESLGGLLLTNILLKKPGLFDKYIIISPSIWWENGATLKLPMPQIERKTDIYIGVGKEGLTPGDPPHVMEVDANLLAEKIRNTKNNYIDCYFDYLPDENHATIAHQAIMNAFKKIFSQPAAH